jgi:hypothetical protein
MSKTAKRNCVWIMEQYSMSLHQWLPMTRERCYCDTKEQAEPIINLWKLAGMKRLRLRPYVAVASMLVGVLLLSGCASPKPLPHFGRYTINVGENNTNACATLMLMNDGTVRWE